MNCDLHTQVKASTWRGSNTVRHHLKKPFSEVAAISPLQGDHDVQAQNVSGFCAGPFVVFLLHFTLPSATAGLTARDLLCVFTA